MSPEVPLRILLVEDSPSDALLTCENLADAGRFDVVHVDCLADALRHLYEGHPIDAALLDLGLPDSEGWSGLQQLHRQSPRLPIVVLTGQTHQDFALPAVQAGAQDFLVKGQCDSRELARAVRFAVERQRLRQDLRESEAKFRLLFEHNPHPMWERELTDRFREMAENMQDVFYNFDPVSGKLHYVSPSFETMWGRPCDALYANPLAYLDFMHPDDRPIAEEALRRQVAGEATDVEFRILHTDGTVRWVRERAFPIRDPSGNVIRIVGSVKETTDSRLTEELLKVSEERFRLLAKATNDAIWDWDLLSGALWWNEGFETLFGYRRDQVEPTIESWSNRVHADDRERIVPSVHRVIESGGTDWMGEYRFLCKRGKYAYVLDRGHIIRDETGQAVRMIGGMTDLTEQKNLETQLLQSQKMEAIGHLAGGVAHDFNNLLTIINGYSEIMMSMLPAEDPMQPMLAGIYEAGDRAANLTRQLLAFSRKQVLAPKILDLNTVVSNVERMLKRLIGEDIRVTTRLQPKLARILVDLGQLEQVIINLALNARDAMPAGGRLSIESFNVRYEAEEIPETSDAKPGAYVALTVSDSGCGIPPEVQAHIFEPFFTTKEVGKGTGLGLATVFGIVKQSQAYIDVESTVGVGTRFRILFPAVDEQAKPLSPNAATWLNGTETILLVEDDPAVQGIAKLALETQGYRVLAAGNGRDAIQIYESSGDEVKIVVTDVVMPEMSGREMIQELRRRDSAIKVLYISGYTDDAIVRHGVVEATDQFLQKPFSPLTLARKIREVLDGERK